MCVSGLPLPSRATVTLGAHRLHCFLPFLPIRLISVSFPLRSILLFQRQHSFSVRCHPLSLYKYPLHSAPIASVFFRAWVNNPDNPIKLQWALFIVVRAASGDQQRDVVAVQQDRIQLGHALPIRHNFAARVSVNIEVWTDRWMVHGWIEDRGLKGRERGMLILTSFGATSETPPNLYTCAKSGMLSFIRRTHTKSRERQCSKMRAHE